ncbi:MAG: hypothetical protein Q8Q33_07840, partial [Chlamydiota bacterium]|nr:hypothetical protein [Chlamydiota bacterium]
MGIKRDSVGLIADAPNISPCAFQPSFIDFKKGIRVGHLDENARLSRILKNALHEIFGEVFLVDRWGRGVYWEYIWFTPQRSWKKKNIKGRGHFESAKFFVGLDSKLKEFRAGIHIESGYTRSVEEPRYQRNDQWDWNRMMKTLKGNTHLHAILKQLINEEQFRLQIGFSEDRSIYDCWDGPKNILKEIQKRLCENWVVVQFFHAYSKQDL